MTEIREDMLKVKRMVSEVEMIIGKREGETELVNKLIDAENLLTYCMSRLENAIVLPCKVGDTVYFIIDDAINGESFIDSQRINDVSTRGIFVSSSTLEENCDSFESYSCLGKTAFLTREEAEKVLAKRNCDIAENIESCEDCGFCERDGASDG